MCFKNIFLLVVIDGTMISVCGVVEVGSMVVVLLDMVALVVESIFEVTPLWGKRVVESEVVGTYSKENLILRNYFWSRELSLFLF